MMRRSTNWLVGAAASIALLTAGIAAHAQDPGDDAAPPPPPPPPSSASAAAPAGTDSAPPSPFSAGGGRGNRPGGGFRPFGGQVTAVTSTGFTFLSRRGNDTITVTTTPQTTYTDTHDAPLSSIKIGDQMTAMGPSDATAKTVQAYRIADGATPQFGAPRGGGANPFAAYMTKGTVVSTSPLKLKDAQGDVYTVTPAGQSSNVSFTATGSAKDVAVGKYVTIRPSSAGGADVSPTATAITADTVIISPTAPRGFNGRGSGRGGFGRPGGGGYGGGAGATN